MRNKIGWGALAVIAIGVIAFVVKPNSASVAAPPKSAPPRKDIAKVESTTSTPLPSVPRDVLSKASPMPAAPGTPPPQTARKINISYYDKAIQGLGLSSAEIEALRGFLVARAEAGYVARDVVNTTPGGTAADLINSANMAREEIDAEMQKYFGEEKYSRIKKMQDGVAYLGLEQQKIGPALAKAGLPQMTPSQVLKLAEAMTETYGSGIRTIPPTRFDPTTGLTNRDIPVLEKAITFLSPEQVAVLQSSLVELNRNQKPK